MTSSPSWRSSCANCPWGFSDVTLAIGYLGDLIRSYVGDGSKWGLRIDYTTEDSPLGTIGPVLQLMDRLPPEFLVMNGDVLTDLNYADLLANRVPSHAPLTVATYSRQVNVDFGVLTSDAGHIVEFTEKPTLHYQVSMGVYGLSRQTLADYLPGAPLGFDELMLDLPTTSAPHRRSTASTATGSTSAARTTTTERTPSSTNCGEPC